jgi:hydroxyacylglutathione hydrolase
MLQIHQFPCRHDNYGFLLHDPASGRTAAIDTPDAAHYLTAADTLGWTITEIWNTHWHPDHVGGNSAVQAATGAVIYAPADEAARIPAIDHALAGGDRFLFGAVKVNVIAVPGHTLGHIAYHLPAESIAFVGDAVFALGCGRVFEGTMDMMWDSLQRLKALPADTALYCAHEYTESNARFAVTIEPGNADLIAYVADIKARRARGEWTVPTLMSRELATNPFLRADAPGVQSAMGHPGDAVATFAEIRGRKDRF